MGQYLPLVILAAVLAGMVAFSRRNKQRAAAAEDARRRELGPGSAVMTTSGLYATVVAMNPDDTALLSIAAGVEVKWALAALRGVEELPDRYREAIQPPGTEAGAIFESGRDSPPDSQLRSRPDSGLHDGIGPAGGAESGPEPR